MITSDATKRGRGGPLGAVAAFVLAACATMGTSMGDAVDRPALAVPDRFVLEMTAPADTMPGAGCRSPLYDPRDGTRIIMRRSAERVGDYSVPAGRYGVDEAELLRVVCNTGVPLGIVRR